MDLTSLSEQLSFIDTSVMRQFFIKNNTGNNVPYDQHPFINYDLNLAQLDIQEFTWNDAIKMFQSNLFNQSHSIERNKQMIQFFYSTIELNENENFNILKIPFLLDQNNHLQLITNIYFSIETIDDQTETNINVSFVNKNIFDWLSDYKQLDIKQWLQRLGVTERTDLTYVYKTIIPNASSYITLENSIETMKGLFLLFQNNNIGNNELVQLKQLKLLTTRRTLVAAEQCYFSDEYQPRLPIEEYFKTKDENFLSSIYLETDNKKNEREHLFKWKQFFLMMGVHEDTYLIHFNEKLTIDQAVQHGFDRDYFPKYSPNSSRRIKAYSGLKTISFLQQTKDDNDFAKQFWSSVIQNFDPSMLKQSTRIYLRANNGSEIPYHDYVQWFMDHVECLPTTMKTCQSRRNTFFDTDEMKNLWSTYIPFIDIPLIENKPEWRQYFLCKTKLSPKEYFVLLDRIRQDETNISENQQSIQTIYFHLMNDIHSWQYKGAELKSIYLLAENNQWELSSSLYFCVESDGDYIQYSNIVPYLKLDFRNRKHPKFYQFLLSLNIKQIRHCDYHICGKNRHQNEKFRLKLVYISPFIKNWLKKLSFQSGVIESIDQIIEKQISFTEFDYLELVYKEKVVQKMKVYYEYIEKHLYITRPWDSEATMMELPNKLCQVLNIQGFEDKIRFLLKATIKEIRNYFQEYSIDIPTERDIVIFRPFEKQGSIELSAKQTATVSEQVPISDSFQLNDLQFDHIQVIDVSSLLSSERITFDDWWKSFQDDHRLSLSDNQIAEQLVCKYLQMKYSTHSYPVSIKWENQLSPSYSPYDIILDINGQEHFIKVRTVPLDGIGFSFYLSIDEIEAIMKYGENYFIYHVYTKEKLLAIFDNIQWHLTNQQYFSCTLTIKKLPLNQPASEDH